MKLYTHVPNNLSRSKKFDPAYIIYHVCHCKYRFSDDALVVFYGVFDSTPEVMPFSRFKTIWMSNMYLAQNRLSKSLFHSLWIRFVCEEKLNSVIIYRKEDDGQFTIWAEIEESSLEDYLDTILPF